MPCRGRRGWLTLRFSWSAVTQCTPVTVFYRIHGDARRVHNRPTPLGQSEWAPAAPPLPTRPTQHGMASMPCGYSDGFSHDVSPVLVFQEHSAVHSIRRADATHGRAHANRAAAEARVADPSTQARHIGGLGRPRSSTHASARPQPAANRIEWQLRPKRDPPAARALAAAAARAAAAGRPR